MASQMSFTWPLAKDTFNRSTTGYWILELEQEQQEQQGIQQVQSN
jgi:hypothetical protein